MADARRARPLAAVGGRPEHCPRCAYDLRGLPERHACPECGFEYDADTLMIYGTAWGQAPAEIWWLRMYWVVFPIIMVVAQLTRRMWWIHLVWIAVGVSVLAFWIWRWKRRQQRGGNAQLLVTPNGISLRDGPGEPKWRPWDEINHVRVRRLWTWGLSWRRPLRPRWSITFSSGTPFDPSMMNAVPVKRGALWVSLGFDATPGEAERVRQAVERIRGQVGGT